MDNCPNCGRELPIMGGGAFCTHCGSMVGAGTPGASAAQPSDSQPTQILPAVVAPAPAPAPAPAAYAPPPAQPQYGAYGAYGSYEAPYEDEYYDAPARSRSNLGVVIAIGVAVVAVGVVGISVLSLGGGSKAPVTQAPVATEVVTPTNPVTPSAQAPVLAETGVGSTSSPTPTPTPKPQAAPVVGVGSSRCMDIPGANPADGNQLDLFDCNGTPAQAWTYVDGTVRAMGKCLDVRGADRQDATPVQVFTCNGTPAQHWTYNPGTGELKTLGKCLDASGAATGNHTPLILYTCNKGTNQKWSMTGARR